MADVKISELPTGSASDTDLIPVVDGGATKKISLSALSTYLRSSGWDVTGTVTADGLVVDGAALLSGSNLTHTFKTTASSISSSTTLLFNNRDGNGNYHDVASITGITSGNGGSGDIVFNTQYSGTGMKKRMEIDRTGDISFYEDTGTTPKFHWDASAERLDIDGTIAVKGNNFLESDGTNHYIKTTATGANYLYGGNNIALTANSSGNVGIGTSSPQQKLHMHQADSGQMVLAMTNTTTGSGNNDGLHIGIASNEDAFLWNKESTNLLFATNNTERMRIDSSGHFSYGGALKEYKFSGYTNSGAQVDIDIPLPSGASGAFVFAHKSHQNGAWDSHLVAFCAMYGSVSTSLTQRVISQNSGHTGTISCSKSDITTMRVTLGSGIGTYGSTYHVTVQAY